MLLIALAPLSLLPLAYWLYRWLVSHYAGQPVWLVGLCVFAIASISYGSLPSRSDLHLVWRHGRASLALLAIGGLGLLWLWVSTSPK